MGRFGYVLFIVALFLFNIIDVESYQVTLEELENNISPEDLKEFMLLRKTFGTTTEASRKGSVNESVNCFGLMESPWLPLKSIFNMKPDSGSSVNTHFYFMSRNKRTRVQVLPGKQFGLDLADFKPNRTTVLIVHGFLSNSNASWVNDMAEAFLTWGDVNVITVDWSGGGSTFKYWKAVANTRQVGLDIFGFMTQLIKASGAKTKDMHFIGHSLGAHIVSFASHHLGKVGRITGLDPAQPCFRTVDDTERLDDTDADYVDIIHTNGRYVSEMGFGYPGRTGHADFYPNGGMKQPGCYEEAKSSKWSLLPFAPKLMRAICYHGRSYLLFTESLINKSCRFGGHKWDLTYEGVNTSLKEADCKGVNACPEMGINAVGMKGVPRAKGSYYVLTTDKTPYCTTDLERYRPHPELLSDLKTGFCLDWLNKETEKDRAIISAMSADPKCEGVARDAFMKRQNKPF